MRLSSNADGGAIPQRYTCDGEDVSPPLAWTDVPMGARSLVLLCDDPDAPAGTWHHWAIYDIPPPPTGRTLRKARATPGRSSSRRPMTSAARRHGRHHYHFRLLALSVASLTLRDEPTCRDVEREARKHVLSEATLAGVYQR